MALIAFDARDAFVAMPHGSGIYVRCLLEALQRQPLTGHELWPLTQGGRGPEVFYEQVTLPRLLRRRNAALVHGPDSFLPLRRHCPGIVTVYDLGFEAIPGDMPAVTAAKYRLLVRLGARSADLVICPSAFTAEDLQMRYGIARERIRVIHGAPALPPGRLAPPAGPYLLAAGDLRRRKNLPVLIDAFRLLVREGLPHRLVLAGADVGLGRELRAQAGDLPLELPGFVDDERLDALIRGADALVLPAVYEGFGLVALEAMVRGCPAVLARAGALPETGGDAALYFDPDDPADLADALRRIAGDAPLRARLGEAGRARAASFSWDTTAAATLAVYEELL
jgi:glycosyltransferase involved in cell wall biosynthesis